MIKDMRNFGRIIGTFIIDNNSTFSFTFRLVQKMIAFAPELLWVIQILSEAIFVILRFSIPYLFFTVNLKNSITFPINRIFCGSIFVPRLIPFFVEINQG